MLEDLLVAAFQDAKRKVEAAVQAKMQESHRRPAAAARPQAVLKLTVPLSLAGEGSEAALRTSCAVPLTGPSPCEEAWGEGTEAAHEHSKLQAPRSSG